MSEEMISLGAKLAAHAQNQPDALAVTCDDEQLSYGELHRATNRAARGLLAKGVKFGDLVTLGLPNSVDYVLACWAIWKIGATPQPVSFRSPPAEVSAIADLARTPIIIGAFNQAFTQPMVSVQALLSLSNDTSDLPDVTAPVSKAPTSGGSTGRPKLILSGSPGETLRDTPAVGGWQLTPHSVALLPAPLYHNAGFGMMMSVLNLGAHLVLMRRFDPEAVLADIQDRHATWIYLVPTMMNRIWRLPSDVRSRYDLSSLQTLWHLAAPCPPWLKEAFIHWMGGEVIQELYAGTEAQASTVISGTEWLERRGSVGKVRFGEMQAFNDDGEPLPPRAVGEIYMRRSPGSPLSYRYVGATAKVLEGGWESLGDIGWFDEDGYLYLADRRTDMILVGGSNVYPAEIEAALEAHEAVGSSAVIGLPDDDLGNTIHAIVQVIGTVDENELRRSVAERLVTYKQPRTYEFVTTPLRDDAGKVRRTALRDARIAR